MELVLTVAIVSVVAVVSFIIGKAVGQVKAEAEAEAIQEMLNEHYGVSDLTLHDKYQAERELRIELESKVNKFELGLIKPRFE